MLKETLRDLKTSFSVIFEIIKFIFFLNVGAFLCLSGIASAVIEESTTIFIYIDIIYKICMTIWLVRNEKYRKKFLALFLIVIFYSLTKGIGEVNSLMANGISLFVLLFSIVAELNRQGKAMRKAEQYKMEREMYAPKQEQVQPPLYTITQEEIERRKELELQKLVQQSIVDDLKRKKSNEV